MGRILHKPVQLEEFDVRGGFGSFPLAGLAVLRLGGAA